MCAPLTWVDDLEFAAAAARDLDHHAAHGRAAGNQLRHDPLADFAQLGAVGVADREKQRDHHPEQRGFQRLPEAMAEHRHHEAAEEDQQRGVDGERGELVRLETPRRCPSSWRMTRTIRASPRPSRRSQNEAAAGHGRASAAVGRAAPRRSEPAVAGNSAMMRARAQSVSALHCAISLKLRPHPRHSPEPGSIVQILLQGVWMGMAFGGLPGK